MDRFWRSAQGELIRFRCRREEAVHLSLPLDPPTKRTRPGTKAKARALLAEAARSARSHEWPKPRAAIALDLFLASASRNGARVDSVCKWLLDELAGLIYADDRQVKMLFALVSRPDPHPPRKVEQPADADPWSMAALVESFDDTRPREPALYLTAQTRANVFMDMRAVSDLPERWDPFDDEHGLFRRNPVDADFRRDDLVEYRATFDTDSAADVQERQLLRNQIDFHDQAQQQYAVDLVFSSLLTDVPGGRYGIWNRVRTRIFISPYIFDVGVLPGRGEGTAFRAQFRALLEERRERWPGLFPMRARSGISMVLFEDPDSGKDLDNLIRTVLPDILEVLRPQQQDLQGWVADEPTPDAGVPDIPFIEVAAIPARLTDMPPGSVVLGLSTADRFDSWWKRATDHLERVLHDEEEREEWW